MSDVSLPLRPGHPVRRRYSIVGLGARHQVYQDAIETTHTRWAELVAVCDTSPARIDLSRQRAASNH
jgi:hypothetical protein